MDYADDTRPKYFLLNSHLYQQVYFTDHRELYTAEFKSWLLFNSIKILFLGAGVNFYITIKFSTLPIICNRYQML